MSRLLKTSFCAGSSSFDPHTISQNGTLQSKIDEALAKDDLTSACSALFDLAPNDDYTYHAITSVKLPQVQRIIELGRANELHAWYRDENGTPIDPPPQSDIEAYISIFSPSTATVSALKNFENNAKKGSLRAECSKLLSSKRYIHPALVSKLTIPKSKTTVPFNPYLIFWAWSCRSLEWCGPCQSSERRLTSHHVLPVFMHHFGCVTPSHEALEVLKILADGREVADIGSGNGYWTFLLRCYGLAVYPVDNRQSQWRVNWVNDTIVADGIKWLRKRDNGRKLVLLLVYPIVGGTVGGGMEGSFTRDLVESFEGDTIAVAGTQNGNGYTSFKGMTMDQYMEQQSPSWKKIVQLPLPSFAGKDEAFYVFQRDSRLPQS